MLFGIIFKNKRTTYHIESLKRTSQKRTPTALYYNIAVIQYLAVTVTDVG